MRRILGAIIAATAVAAGVILALTGHLVGKLIRSSGNGVFSIVVSDIQWASVLPLLVMFLVALVVLLLPNTGYGANS